ncbi:MAG: four helix bundle protein [Pirellulales bacterium]|nr:four helix bundle protein [Pirellulales bacterium]
MELAKAVYELTHGFPGHERYGLTSQVQRAAVSIPANIAEGHARSTTKQYLYHVSVAMGSVAELETLLALARQFEYGNPESIVAVSRQCECVGRMLQNLHKRLKVRLNDT